MAGRQVGAREISELGCTLMCLETGEDSLPKGEPQDWLGTSTRALGGTYISKQNHIRVL